MRTSVNLIFCLLLLCAVPGPARGGGSFETIDITGRVPSPVPGLVIGRLVTKKWDARCLPAPFRVNDTLDPIPNPLGPSVLTVAQATPVLEQALDVWNSIPTSFIEMGIVGTTSNPGDRGFDMVNEITFRTSTPLPLGALAFSISTELLEDTVLNDGDDIDGDGDSDVSSAISVCADVDGDGDIEFPAGFYKAGTIVDSDVIFDTGVARFTLGPPDAVPDSADLLGFAVHEFGHAHGLSHSPTNQLSAVEGRGAVMFPFADDTDPDDKLSWRTPTTEDIAWSSFFYPEGSADSGPAALGPGDVAFDKRYGRITGEVRHGILEEVIAGANVFAVEKRHGADTIVSSGFSGTIQLHINPSTNAIEFFERLDGKYVVPLPRGKFKVGVEPLDGSPNPASVYNGTTGFGHQFGGHDFNEEFLRRGGGFRSFNVKPGETVEGVDIVTSRSLNIDNFGTLDRIGFIAAPPGRYYAVRIPAAEIMAVFESGANFVIESADFVTGVSDNSVVPVFAEALLTIGTVNLDGTASVDLARPLEAVRNFTGQDFDFARFIFRDPARLTARVQQGITRGRIQNLFLVLRVPTTTPFPGPNGLPPLIGLDGVPGETNDVPIFGLSYISDDGGATFTQTTDRNFMFRLVLRFR